MTAPRPNLQRLLAMVLSFLMASGLAAVSGAQEGAASVRPTEAQLEQLVTPIALYPDTLVAQILAASQYPTQIVEADRFVQQNSSMTPDQLSSAAAKQDWDPSMMAMVRFPSVLHNMDQNLSWTSALGEAYFNDSSGVMRAIQTMRSRAYQAGTLKTTPQQTVTVQNGAGGGTQTIIIQPSNPQVVYVPTYNPTMVYGAPAEVYPGYSSTDMLATALLGFGTGVAVGALASGGWGCNWGGGSVTYNNNVWVAHNNVWGPNRWGPYNPYHPYNPYNPYHPYHPYGPYNPYHPNNPYHPYNPYHPPTNHPLYGQNHPNYPYNRGNQPYQHGYHPTTQGWDNRGLNNYRGYDQHSSNGLENRGAFGDYSRAGDARMASDRGFSSLGGMGHGGGGFHGFHGRR